MDTRIRAAGLVFGVAVLILAGCLQRQLEFSHPENSISSIVVSPTAPEVKALPAITDPQQIAAVTEFLNRKKASWQPRRGKPSEATYMVFLVGPIPLEPIHAGYRFLETKVGDTTYRCDLTDAEFAELMRLLRLA